MVSVFNATESSTTQKSKLCLCRRKPSRRKPLAGKRQPSGSLLRAKRMGRVRTAVVRAKRDIVGKTLRKRGKKDEQAISK
jgi:hypothetical protein